MKYSFQEIKDLLIKLPRLPWKADILPDKVEIISEGNGKLILESEQWKDKNVLNFIIQAPEIIQDLVEQLQEQADYEELKGWVEDCNRDHNKCKCDCCKMCRECDDFGCEIQE